MLDILLAQLVKKGAAEPGKAGFALARTSGPAAPAALNAGKDEQGA